MYIFKRLLCVILILPVCIIQMFQLIFIKKIKSSPIIEKWIEWGFDLEE
jgi:hypothetical protein